MKLYLSNIQNKDKPDSYAIKKISNTILNNLVDISLEEFATELTERGKTVVLAELSEKKLSKTTPIIGQDLIMLDFDNKDLNNIYTIEDLESDIFMQNNAVFYYRTFSDLYSEVDKFRVVFKLETPIKSNVDIENVYRKLFKKYPQADSSVGQTNRMFFGSNSGYIVINWENELSIDEFNKEKESTNDIVVKENVEGIIVDKHLKNYELLKMGRFNIIKEKLGVDYGRIFPDEYNAYLYFKTLDIAEILELPDENPFLDILHKEKNPSASVFYSNKFNCYLYKCFSEKKKFTGNIIELLAEYLNVDEQKITQILIDITNSEVTYTSQLGQTKFNAEIFRNNLLNGDLEIQYPELYKFLKRYSLEIYFTMGFMFNHVNQDLSGEYRYLNYYNRKTLTKMVSKAMHKNITENKMRNILNIIVVTEIIRKLPKKEIPTEIYDSLIKNQEKNKNNLRVSTIYQPNNLNKDNREKMSGIAKVLLDNNATVQSLSFELIYRLFGEEKATNDFEQSYKPLIAKGLKMSDKDVNLTKNSVSLENSAIKIIMKELDSKGYIFEKDLIYILSKNRGVKLASMKQRYSKIRSDLTSKYGLVRLRLNKELYSKLDIKEEYSTKTIIIKDSI